MDHFYTESCQQPSFLVRHFKISNNSVHLSCYVSLKFDTRDECAMHEQYLTPNPPQGAVAHRRGELNSSKTVFLPNGLRIFIHSAFM